MNEGTSEDDALQVPSELANVGTTSIGLGVEQDSAEQPLPATDVGLSETDDGDRTPVEFDPRYRTSFQGLLYIGKVQREFRWMGHSFRIKSPTIDHILEAGQLHKDHVGTVSEIKAWQSLTAAMCIVSVDGRPLPLPVANDESELEAKFNYITSHWYPWTLDKIYAEYLILNAEVQETIDAMGKASGSRESTPGSNSI